jgi:hypothetical protein
MVAGQAQVITQTYGPCIQVKEDLGGLVLIAEPSLILQPGDERTLRSALAALPAFKGFNAKQIESHLLVSTGSIYFLVSPVAVAFGYCLFCSHHRNEFPDRSAHYWLSCCFILLQRQVLLLPRSFLSLQVCVSPFVVFNSTFSSSAF